MKIIFMGTPNFALPALEAIKKSKTHELVAVFTQKPTQSGRGMKVTKSPIHCLADHYKIPIFTPDTLKTQEIYEKIKFLNADVIVVVAYGFIIPKEILKSTKFGCINIHPSQLPKYRGAAPMQHAILNGEKETAVCIMQMDEGLDTGDILIQQNVPMHDRITFNELHDMCADIGANLLIKLLNNIHGFSRTKQSKTGESYAKKLTKEDSKINWNDDINHIDRKIRAINNAYFMHNGKRIKVISAKIQKYSDCIVNPETNKEFLSIGEVINNNFDVICNSGILRIISIKPEGKNIMLAKDYLNGIQFNKLQKKTILL